MLLSKYNTIISESKFVLSTLEKINENRLKYPVEKSKGTSKKYDQL